VEVEGEVITLVSVFIPPGHAGNTGFRVLYGEESVVPYNLGGWITGDGETVPLRPFYECPEQPCPLRLQGYNLDPDNSHKFYVRLELLDEVDARPFRLLRGLVELFEAVFGGAAVVQLPRL